MTVVPRESVDKRTLNALKIKSKEASQKGKFGMLKSKFQKKKQ
jgi:hypothetical protein